MEHFKYFIPAFSTLIFLGCAFLLLRFLYIEAKKEAKGKLSPNIRIRRFKDIVSYPDWLNSNYDDIYDTWSVCGLGYTLDEFSLELFKGNPEVIKRLEVYIKTHADLLNEAYDSVPDNHKGCSPGFWCILASIIIVITLLIIFL